MYSPTLHCVGLEHFLVQLCSFEARAYKAALLKFFLYRANNKFPYFAELPVARDEGGVFHRCACGDEGIGEREAVGTLEPRTFFCDVSVYGDNDEVVDKCANSCLFRRGDSRMREHFRDCYCRYKQRSPFLPKAREDIHNCRFAVQVGNQDVCVAEH